MSEPTIVALLHGPDRPGIVARVARQIFESGGNILHADQHHDAEAGVFFQRLEWASGPAGARVDADAFRAMARDELGMEVRVALSSDRPRVVLFVSKEDHCFHDLVLRHRAGELPAEFVGVVSNHDRLAPAAAAYGLAYETIPVSADTRAAAEQAQLDLLRAWNADLVVLARYMQVLSGNFLAAFGRPVINIHHSFLPAFAGARPYHQAHARGVKLIGATAHYVTEDLDAGPIIQQEVAHVTHRHGVADLVRKGRDLEKLVLAQAVRWHLEHRVLAYAGKTVVFD